MPRAKADTRPQAPAALTRRRDLTGEELEALATERFGADPRWWTFGCPSCGELHDAGDFLLAGADPNRVGQECIGRHLGALARDPGVSAERGCDWAAYGLFSGPWFVTVPGRRDDGTVDPDAEHKAVPGFALAETSRDAARTVEQRAEVRSVWDARTAERGAPREHDGSTEAPQTDGPEPTDTEGDPEQ